LADIRLNGVSKNFGSVHVLEDVSLTIEAGEFIVFLGPSGCGKSTLLRMIAGLETVDSGEIYIGDRRVDQLPPGKRGVAMVFQHYALYPHMTTYDNMAFGLRNIALDPAEIDRRVRSAAQILETEALLDRKPGQLSGGQRQRVAIGRAIVKEPDLFLFDEPLSNLDAALRVRTRIELARLHQQVRSTMIFVTHDQVEAMTLASRIVVMNNRRIEQVGTPMEIYTRPATQFVAQFVGAPAMNFMDATVAGADEGGTSIRLPDGTVLRTTIHLGAQRTGQEKLTFGIRAQSVSVDPQGPLRGQAEIIERLGDRTLIHTRLNDGSLIIAEDVGLSRIAAGEPIGLSIDGSAAHLFDAGGLAYHAAR
jgi:multiple sugar transport system ATP-binding protein